MTENPYAAPKAPVSDIEQASVARVRPPQIKLVIQLAVANYLLGIGVVIANWQFYSQRGGVAAFVASQAAGLALAGWFYYKIWQGRNWARIVLLVFSLIGMALTLTSFYRSALAAMPTGVRWMSIVGVVFSIAVLYLLFLSPGRAWFAKRTPDGAL
jgi:hypothetical protein